MKDPTDLLFWGRSLEPAEDNFIGFDSPWFRYTLLKHRYCCSGLIDIPGTGVSLCLKRICLVGI